MTHDHEQHRSDSRAKWVFLVFALIAAYFLITEHRAHLAGVLYYSPFLLLVVCPLLHFFMHGGHGRNETHRNHGATKKGGHP